MRKYQIILNNNKVNFWLLLGILRLDKLECLEKVCIYLYFIVCVMKWIYLYIL